MSGWPCSVTESGFLHFTQLCKELILPRGINPESEKSHLSEITEEEVVT